MQMCDGWLEDCYEKGNKKARSRGGSEGAKEIEMAGGGTKDARIT